MRGGGGGGGGPRWTRGAGGGVAVREPTEHEGVDDGEDGGVAADAEGEGDEGDGGEHRVAAEAARGVAKVLADAAPPAGTGAFGGLDLAGEGFPVGELPVGA